MTAAILNHLWQSSLFALAIWSLTLLFRNNGASVRHALWLAASVKFLLPFSLLAAFGDLAFTHTAAPATMRVLGRIAPAALPFAAPPVPAPSLDWPLIAAVLWAFGALVVVLFWLARAARLRTIVHKAAPLAFDAPIPVRATTALLEPGLAGILRPVILLPESLAQKLSKTEIDAILAHELCHLRRRDNLAALLHMLVEATFWFHPLVWFIGARLVEEREQACDEAVLDEGKKPLDYAQAILKVCRLYFRSPLPCASGVSGADLDRRITAIMVRRETHEVDPNKILLLAGLGAFAVAMPLVLGGLKPAAPARLMQSLVQAITPAERPVELAPAPMPAAPARRTHHLAPLAPLKPATRLVAAPDIDASLPIIVVPSPQLAEPAEAAKPETQVCRPPQRLRDSRLMGPQVCLPQRIWDQFRAKGVVLQPDGKTFAMGYEETRLLRPMTCQSMGTNASAATNWFVACHQ
jgi:beta-lactamase regulating signal transducer with metallopeptidase domain